jgi:hypothetical protein
MPSRIRSTIPATCLPLQFTALALAQFHHIYLLQATKQGATE